MSRKTYTAEFKLQAIQMMAEQGLALAEVARRLGVSESCRGPGGTRPASRARPPSPAGAARRRRTRSCSACGPNGTC